MRCFIGFEIDENCRELMRVRIEPFATRLQKELGWQIRMVPPQNWHLTGLFFKDLEEAERGLVWQEVLRNVAAGVWDDMFYPFERLALWPDPRKPGMVCLPAPEYAGVAEWPLVKRLEEEPFSKGDTEHLRAYRPHITLMRFQGRSARQYWREWQAFGDRIPAIPPTAVRFNRVSLFLSNVAPNRPIYPREYTARIKSGLKMQDLMRLPTSVTQEE